MILRQRLPALLAALALCVGGAAHAAPFNEIGDGVELLGTAQVLGAGIIGIQNPTGAGPLADWNGSSATGTYTIELRTATVPLPGSLPLAALALGALALSRRRT